MACQKFCCFRKARLNEESDCMLLAIEVFLTAHRLLKNFMDFFKFHAGKCCGINYDEVPLHGALDVAAVAMASIICGNMPKKEFQRPGLFNTCLCMPCRDTQCLPEDLMRRVDTVLSCLRKPCSMETIIYQIKEILSTLEALPPCIISDKLQMLSLLLKEIMKKFICCGHGLGEPLGNTQAKQTLNLVNNFIRDWSEKRSAARPFSLRLCRFCDRVVSETTRQWGTFCCNDAHLFDSIRKEWVLRQSISNTPIEEPCDCIERHRSPNPVRFRGIDKDSEIHAPSEKLHTLPISDREISDAEPERRFSAKYAKQQPATSPRKIDPEAREDPDKKQISKIEQAQKKSHDIHKRDKYPISPDGEDKRHGVPHKRKLVKLRSSRDADEEGVASGKSRKMRTALSETESEGRKADRPRSRKEVASEETEKLGRGGGRKKLYRNALSESGEGRHSGKTNDTDDEEGAGDKRGRKKARKRRDVDEDERGGSSGRRKKIDASDSERKGMSQSGDEEGKVRKRDGKRKGRSDGDESDSDFERKRGGAIKKESGDEEGTVRKRDGKRKGKSKGDESDSDFERKRGGAVKKESGDEEGTVRKRDGKRKGKSEGDESDSDFGRKRGVKTTSSDDKFTGDSDRKKKEKSASSKGRRSVSSKKEDDYSRTHVSRYRPVQQAGYRSSIEYQLSNQHFVKLGWTVLPVAKTMSRVVQYQTRPAKPHLDWFTRHRVDGCLYYDDEKSLVFANFPIDGSAEVFYPNGVLAIRVHRPPKRKYDMYTVFSPGGKDCMGVERNSQVVAVFDTIGNGAVFNEDGATRLSYNQIGGIWRDSPAGVPVIWKWDADEKKSITKTTVFMEKAAAHLEEFLKSPKAATVKSVHSSGSAKASSHVSSRKEKKVAEQKPVATGLQEEVDEEEVDSEFAIDEIDSEDTYHFKAVCMKLNDYIGLKIFSRRSVSLHFRADRKMIRIELGTILNLNKEVASYFVDSSIKYGMLKCKFEDIQPCRLALNNSAYSIAEELQEVRKSARHRNYLMTRYRPFLRKWKNTGTRCRPR